MCDEDYQIFISDSVHETISGYNKYRDFTTLKAWQDARKVKLFFYRKVIPMLPPSKKFNLDTQIRKASIGATANIAECYGRYHYKEGIQFYRTARGSLYELKDHLISCLDFDYINKDIFNEGLNLIETAKISISGYINYTKQRMNEK